MDIWTQPGEWVILAEKPSVAKHIATAISNKLSIPVTRQTNSHYIKIGKFYITWAFGHLLALAMPNDYNPTYTQWKMDKYPFIPEQFKWVNIKKGKKVDKSVKAQLDAIQQICSLPTVKGYVMATDYDREGQLIGNEIFATCVQKPIYRMLLNEWTNAEVQKSMSNLLDSNDQSLVDLSTQGYNRLFMDWIIGMNLTPMFSLAMSSIKSKDTIYNLGRVIMPTLSILYDRNSLVQATKDISYHNVVQEIIIDNIPYNLYLCYKGNKVIYTNSLEALQFAQSLKGYPYISEQKSSVTKQYPPKLFSMTTLQKHILSSYKGFTSDKVLSIAQSLYEKKLITYPRTESNYLEDSLYPKVSAAITANTTGTQYDGVIKPSKTKRVFDNSKVHSHSAIIPTTVAPTTLSDNENIVYWEILKRFLANFMPPAILRNTEVTLNFNEDYLSDYCMHKTISTTLYDGWKVIESAQPLLPQPEINEQFESLLFTYGKSFVCDDLRSQPKHLTEQELLSLMQSCGKFLLDDDKDDLLLQQAINTGFSLGTSATRSDIIEKLIRVNYVTRHGNTLVITRKGMDVIQFFPYKEMLSPNYAGKLESKLSNCKDDSILKEVISKIHEVANIFNNDLTIRTSVGTCPICGFPLLDGNKSFGCTNYDKKCMYHISKEDETLQQYGIYSVDATMVHSILSSGYITTPTGNKLNYYCDAEGNSYYTSL